ncbi:MAG TPA: Flp family type IVb pilin [Dehalococcoidia bacterium]|jgi:Flp pilus assembly pilin Flp|nr:Flp family type IVb pilin [Dehalococcoidia bacterium]
MFIEKVTTAIRRLISNTESGQTLVEYGLIIGLVAIAAIVGVSLVADQVGSLWGGNAQDIGDAIANVLGI